MSESTHKVNELRQILKDKFKQLRLKINKPLFATIIIGLAVPLTVFLSMQKTNLKQHAASENAAVTSFKIPSDYIKKYPLDINTPIVNLQISGRTILFSGQGYVRVVLVDKNKNEYLVYENYPLISQNRLDDVINSCEETCVLPSIVPDYLRIEGNSSDFTVSKINTGDKYDGKIIKNMLIADVKNLSSNIKRTKDLQKLEKVKDKIEKNKISWKAGETSISKLTYAQKRKIFNLKQSDHLPNLQGLEYYKGGIFELGLASNSFVSSGGYAPTPAPTGAVPPPVINLPKSWDYRNYQGENWNTSIKNQGGCGSCWDFAAAATVEGVANLYYNQHLNLDLSEQDILSCGNAGTCAGGWSSLALSYVKTTGVSDEACYTYQATDLSCSNKCSDSQSRATKISDTQSYYGSSTSPDKIFDSIIKNKLIYSGVVSAVVPSMNHVMSLVGWQDDPVDNTTVWIFKNSWGSDWGEGGYGRLKETSAWISQIDTVVTPVTVANMSNLQTACTDKDQDNYCSWGISSTKPSSCPLTCKPEEDCNDSDSNALGFDENHNCTYLVPPQQDIIPPTAPTLTYVNNYVIPATYNNVETRWAELYWNTPTDNVGVFGYEVYMNGVKVGYSSNGFFSYQDNNLKAGDTLSFYVRAYDAMGNFSPNSNIMQTVVVPAPTPYPTPIYAKEFTWKTNYASLYAGGAYMQIDNKYYYFPISGFSLNSSPAYLSSDGYYYTTLESNWIDNNIPMKMNWYFKYKPGQNWQVYELRTYDGTSNGDWVYYGSYNTNNGQTIQAAVGQPYTGTSIILTGSSRSGIKGAIYFDQMSIQPFFTAPTPTITPTFTPTPKPTATPTPKPTATPTLKPTPTPTPLPSPTGLSSSTFCQGTVGINEASGVTYKWNAVAGVTYYLQSYSGKTDVNTGTSATRKIPSLSTCITGPGGCSYLYGETISWQVKACNTTGCSSPAKATVATKYCSASFNNPCARCAVKQSNGKYLVGGMCGADGKTLCKCSGFGTITSKSTCSTSCQVNSGTSDTCASTINLCSRCAIRQGDNKYLIGGACSFDGKTLCSCSGAGITTNKNTCLTSCNSIPGASDICFK